LLAANALLPNSVDANADDLLIVIKAESDDAAGDALAQVDGLLARRRSSGAERGFRPHSLRAAAKLLPEAGWILISTPGRYAGDVAREALELDKHVFLYSDNVGLADEIELKQRARSKGLLVMGPDCGTAIINGIGLGFANRVRRGEIGLVGASGTGLQAVTSQIHTLGAGISHAIGTGGRDLQSDVGATTSLQAIDLLARDADTKVIVLVSKPPAPAVAAMLLAAAQSTGKPVVVDFIGYPAPARSLGNLHFAFNLDDAAEIAVRLSGAPAPTATPLPPIAGFLRGLFSGGTLAYEALLSLQTAVFPIYSNAPITEDQLLADPLRSNHHTIVDMGDEYFMVGRLHPMIDNDLRIRRLRQEAADPEVALILLDVVLGEGAHPDPAGELAPVIREIKGRRAKLEVAAIVIGTDADSQDLDSQLAELKSAGAVVYLSVAEAMEHIIRRLSAKPSPSQSPLDLERFTQPLSAINVGIESFYESLQTQGARAVQVDWRPPAGGNEQLASLLARMKT
jgi:FdrA protein